MSLDFPAGMPGDIREAFEGLDPPTGPAVPKIAMLDLVQALVDYRLQSQHGPPPVRIHMSLLARRAFLGEVVRLRAYMKTDPIMPPAIETLPIVLDEAAEGFSVRVE